MHLYAKEWDDKHGDSSSMHHYRIINRLKTPRGRPCNYCGSPVKLGYIHNDCIEEEFYNASVVQ